MKIRQPAVAGLFYPEDPETLRADVRKYLAASTATGTPPRAFIAPHAGYLYSGPVAGTIYALIASLKGTVRRAAVFGPAHRYPVSGLALSGAEAFRTPLGDVPVDRAAVDQLAKLPQTEICEAAHEQEHSLEVQLPFLQETLGDFSLVPVAAGDVAPEEVARALELLWDDATLIVISTDLSHFLNYERAKELDARTALAIEQMKPAAIKHEQACGGMLIRGLLQFARKHGLRPRTLDLRNSGDTAGGRDRVVGYGAFSFENAVESGTDE